MLVYLRLYIYMHKFCSVLDLLDSQLLHIWIPVLTTTWLKFNTLLLVSYSLCPFSKWGNCVKWTDFSLWKIPLSLLMAIYIRLLGLSPFPCGPKCISWELGATHILKKNTSPRIDCAWKLNVKYIISGVTSLKKWKNLPFSSSLVFRLPFSFSEVTG